MQNFELASLAAEYSVETVWQGRGVTRHVAVRMRVSRSRGRRGEVKDPKCPDREL